MPKALLKDTAEYCNVDVLSNLIITMTSTESQYVL